MRRAEVIEELTRASLVQFEKPESQVVEDAKKRTNDEVREPFFRQPPGNPSSIRYNPLNPCNRSTKFLVPESAEFRPA
jgi:hypothetical protein